VIARPGGCVHNAAMIHNLIASLLLLVGYQPGAESPLAPTSDRLHRITVRSSIDDEPQTCRVHIPDGDGRRPMLVFLHSWSSNVEQDNSRWADLAIARGWVVLLPDFRGANTRPESCGSALARQDILDAIDWMIDHHAVDTRRIYLAGTSGGGHMSLLMAARHPDKFSAVSAWASISDLRAWWEFTSKDERFERYARNIEAIAGGAPGASTVDRQLRERSSLPGLANASCLPLDINAGHLDGTTGSVPWRHSVEAFNAIRRTRGACQLDPDTIDLRHRTPDEIYGRDVLFRSTCGAARLTVFDGGHEDIAEAGIAFLEKIERPTSWIGSKAPAPVVQRSVPSCSLPSFATCPRWRGRILRRCR
jgi:poly(3-hydroxybutyrate) depolymerase